MGRLHNAVEGEGHKRAYTCYEGGGGDRQEGEGYRVDEELDKEEEDETLAG